MAEDILLIPGGKSCSDLTAMKHKIFNASAAKTLCWSKPVTCINDQSLSVQYTTVQYTLQCQLKAMQYKVPISEALKFQLQVQLTAPIMGHGLQRLFRLTASCISLSVLT
jgi:hypothetical protein